MEHVDDYLGDLRETAGFNNKHEGIAFASSMMPLVEEGSFLDRIDNVDNFPELTEGERKYVGAHVLLSRGNDLLERMIRGEKLNDMYSGMKEEITLHNAKEWIKGPYIPDQTREDYKDLDQLVNGNSAFLERMPYGSVGNLVAYTTLVGSFVLFGEALDLIPWLEYKAGETQITNPDKSLGMAVVSAVGMALGVKLATGLMRYNVVKRPAEEDKNYTHKINEFQTLFDKYVTEPLTREKK